MQCKTVPKLCEVKPRIICSLDAMEFLNVSDIRIKRRRLSLISDTTKIPQHLSVIRDHASEEENRWLKSWLVSCRGEGGSRNVASRFIQSINKLSRSITALWGHRERMKLRRDANASSLMLRGNPRNVITITGKSFVIHSEVQEIAGDSRR